MFTLPEEYITFCKEHTITTFKNGIPYEKHHILPKCKQGKNDNENLCYLTVEDHFKAHLLLAELTNDAKLWGILYMMLHTRKNTKITLADMPLYVKIRENYRKAASITGKERWKDPVYRAARIKSASDAWKKEGYRENRKLKMQKYYDNPVYKEKLSKKIKEAWKNPEYRKKCVITEKPKEQQIEIYKKVSASLKRVLSTPEARKLKRLRSKQMWSNPEFRKKRQENAKKRKESKK